MRSITSMPIDGRPVPAFGWCGFVCFRPAIESSRRCGSMDRVMQTFPNMQLHRFSIPLVLMQDNLVSAIVSQQARDGR